MKYKRLFDVLFSIAGIIILLPVFLIICLSIIIFSGLPIFFFQKRIGRNGNVFRIIKFRTMVKNAENLPGGSYTTLHDSRITKVGKFLRRWKLDELPSLFNVQ